MMADVNAWRQAMAIAETAPKAKLTADQRRRVRELMQDEGNTRAEAVAWVLAFEPATVQS